MAFLDRVLDPPSYGFLRDGKFYKPTHAEIFREFLSRLNLFGSRLNWLPAFSWAVAFLLVVPFVVFVGWYFSWPLALLGMTYAMVALGSHGTFWLHRYCTHRAFSFSNSFIKLVCRNLTIRIIPEEVYVVSHHVHHHFSEQPGDPYNVHGGWLYCFLADANHQGINKALTPTEYDQLLKLMRHTGVRLNSYEQYRKWGSVCHPMSAIAHFAANWAAWFGIFYWMGGPALATAIFGCSAVWAFGVRTFNYDGHGQGKDKRVEGIDFNRDDLSVNQIWPGYVSGEWHNNHHLYPAGARAGFLKYQLDLPWLLIRFLRATGAVHGVRDYKADFMRDYYDVWRSKQASLPIDAAPVPVPARQRF